MAIDRPRSVVVVALEVPEFIPGGLGGNSFKEKS